MTIDYVVKKKAIELHLQGRGRNEICRILNGQKMRISEATITHLIQDWKRHHQQQQTKCNNLESSTDTASPPAQLQKQQEQQEQEAQETITISPKRRHPQDGLHPNIGL